MNKNPIKNKRAQVGESITWLFATLIIIVILIIAIIFSNISILNLKKIKTDSSSITSDVLASKSLFSYALTKNDGKFIYDEINDDGNLNEANGNLGLSIFKNIYGREYPTKIWLGIIVEYKEFIPLTSLPNLYFGERTFGSKEKVEPISGYSTEKIELKEEQDKTTYLNVILIK